MSNQNTNTNENTNDIPINRQLTPRFCSLPSLPSSPLHLPPPPPPPPPRPHPNHLILNDNINQNDLFSVATISFTTGLIIGYTAGYFLGFSRDSLKNFQLSNLFSQKYK